jgi:hypothetical protein
MDIRYSVPCDFRFQLRCEARTAPIPAPGNYTLRFRFGGYEAAVTPGTNHRVAMWHEEPSGKDLPIYRVLDLSFQVRDDTDCRLETLCTKAQWRELAQLLIDITNHALLNIRIYGGVTSVHAIPSWIPFNSPATIASPLILAEMNAETSADGGMSWTLLPCGWESHRDGQTLKEMVLGVPMAGASNAETWMHIETTLGTVDPPDFARVCLANAKESSLSGDGRSAVLEVVFALEVVVNRILDYYCSRLVPEKARNFKNIGFPEKLFLALPLATGQFWDYLLKSDATEALSAIADRNKVAHKGDLTLARADTKEFWDGVHSTMTLVETLLQHEDLFEQRIDRLMKPEGEASADAGG